MKKPKKNSKSSISDKVLLLIFIIMVIVVIALMISAISLKNKKENDRTNIIIPIIETNSKNEISVDLSEMEKGQSKEYVFKIINYKDKVINNKVINYNIDITSSDKASIKLYKNDNKDNLIDDEKMIVENNELLKNKKMEDEYRMIINIEEAPEDNDKITIKIAS